MNYTNEILARWVRNNCIKCPSCNQTLKIYKIKNFDDTNGIMYEDFPIPQQVTFKCPRCNQRSSINKMLKKYPI